MYKLRLGPPSVRVIALARSESGLRIRKIVAAALYDVLVGLGHSILVIRRMRVRWVEVC